MTHPALSRKFPLHLLPSDVQEVVRAIQRMIQKDDANYQLQDSYPLYFMDGLTLLQRRQVIAFVEATPLRSRSRNCYLRAVHRPLWLFWVRMEVPARLCLEWVEEKQAFLVVPIIIPDPR